MDVARKALILAREIGINAEISDIVIIPPIPKDCLNSNSVEEFYEKLEAFDFEMNQKIVSCRQKGNKLCYLAEIKDSNIIVSLQEIGIEHPFYNLSSTDNIIKITSNRYEHAPMIIRARCRS